MCAAQLSRMDILLRLFCILNGSVHINCGDKTKDATLHLKVALWVFYASEKCENDIWAHYEPVLFGKLQYRLELLCCCEHINCFYQPQTKYSMKQISSAATDRPTNLFSATNVQTVWHNQYSLYSFFYFFYSFGIWSSEWLAGVHIAAIEVSSRWGEFAALHCSRGDFFFFFWCLVLMATAWAAFSGAVLSMQLS